ncbi:MAG: hypothetical protein EHM20_01040 [Alphaproteobacteria bacterium]|nr:MAG: hypothetical protein EHM20_01040 [Alphaproteobacteria bacterium]
MKETKNKKNDLKGMNKEQSRGRWMAPGIGIGATLGIFFGNFVLGPALGSQTTGFIIGMSMGVGAGLVLGLSRG